MVVREDAVDLANVASFAACDELGASRRSGMTMVAEERERPFEHSSQSWTMVDR